MSFMDILLICSGLRPLAFMALTRSNTPGMGGGPLPPDTGGDNGIVGNGCGDGGFDTFIGVTSSGALSFSSESESTRPSGSTLALPFLSILWIQKTTI